MCCQLAADYFRKRDNVHSLEFLGQNALHQCRVATSNNQISQQKAKLVFTFFWRRATEKPLDAPVPFFFRENPKCVGDLTPSIHARCQSPSYLDGNFDGLAGCRASKAMHFPGILFVQGELPMR